MADVVEKRVAGQAQAPAVRKRGGGYGGRFVLAHLLVVAGFGAVLLLFAFLVSRSDSSRAWSSYEPSGRDAFDKAQNMANHVAPRYVYGGVPIAVVQAQPLIYRDVVVDGIAITRAPFRNIGTHYRQFEPADSTMLYVFCGQATRCGLPETGAPDVVALLRRESLELALYTFKYWPDVKAIVSLLPPTKETSPAVYFKRRDLEKELSKPLDETLPTRRLVTPESMTGREQATVDRLTSSRIFPSSFQQLANGRTVLLLGSSNR